MTSNIFMMVDIYENEPQNQLGIRIPEGQAHQGSIRRGMPHKQANKNPVFFSFIHPFGKYKISTVEIFG